MQRNNLWIKALTSKCGESKGRKKQDGSHGSDWWKHINKIKRGVCVGVNPNSQSILIVYDFVSRF